MTHFMRYSKALAGRSSVACIHDDQLLFGDQLT